MPMGFPEHTPTPKRAQIWLCTPGRINKAELVRSKEIPDANAQDDNLASFDPTLRPFSPLLTPDTGQQSLRSPCPTRGYIATDHSFCMSTDSVLRFRMSSTSDTRTMHIPPQLGIFTSVHTSAHPRSLVLVAFSSGIPVLCLCLSRLATVSLVHTGTLQEPCSTAFPDLRTR
ncbi:hypothetical protein BV20DRAFT_277411 [Pilatotrama ljubarskyi]|nr:hypothetical protein BV20DRAFT_277411 [Pilatotrama ljubarskyi]